MPATHITLHKGADNIVSLTGHNDLATGGTGTPVADATVTFTLYADDGSTVLAGPVAGERVADGHFRVMLPAGTLAAVPRGTYPGVLTSTANTGAVRPFTLRVAVV